MVIDEIIEERAIELNFTREDVQQLKDLLTHIVEKYEKEVNWNREELNNIGKVAIYEAISTFNIEKKVSLEEYVQSRLESKILACIERNNRKNVCTSKNIKEIEDEDRETSNVIKIFGSYISNIHLASFLIPYLEETLEHKVKVATILENEIKEIVDFARMRNANTKILDIEWQPIEQSEIENIIKELDDDITEEQMMIINGKLKFFEDTGIKQLEIENIIEKLENNIAEEQMIIINGKIEFIQKIQRIVQAYIKHNQTKLEKSKIKIITLYNNNDFLEYGEQIIKNNDKVLNTSGERAVQEVFQEILGYKAKNVTTEIDVEEIYAKMQRYKQLLKDGEITQSEYDHLCIKLKETLKNR